MERDGYSKLLAVNKLEDLAASDSISRAMCCSSPAGTTSSGNEAQVSGVSQDRDNSVHSGHVNANIFTFSIKLCRSNYFQVTHICTYTSTLTLPVIKICAIQEFKTYIQMY